MKLPKYGQTCSHNICSNWGASKRLWRSPPTKLSSSIKAQCLDLLKQMIALYSERNALLKQNFHSDSVWRALRKQRSARWSNWPAMGWLEKNSKFMTFSTFCRFAICFAFFFSVFMRFRTFSKIFGRSHHIRCSVRAAMFHRTGTQRPNWRLWLGLPFWLLHFWRRLQARIGLSHYRSWARRPNHRCSTVWAEKSYNQNLTEGKSLSPQRTLKAWRVGR